eukprot:gene14493-14288_t
MIYYIFLFATSQSPRIQRAWMKSTLLGLLNDILLISTLVTVVTNIVIPSLIVSDASQ